MFGEILLIGKLVILGYGVNAALLVLLGVFLFLYGLYTAFLGNMLEGLEYSKAVEKIVPEIRTLKEGLTFRERTNTWDLSILVPYGTILYILRILIYSSKYGMYNFFLWTMEFEKERLEALQKEKSFEEE